MSKVKWSFSGLKDYINCPKQYHEVKIVKNYVKNVTPQMRYGTEVHKSLEDYAALGTPLPKNYLRYKAIMDTLSEIGGQHYNERKMALKEDKTPCEFDDPEYWVRGIVDRLIIDSEDAYVIDYKTGSNRYPDPKQLQLMSLFTFEHHPEVNIVKGGLLFVAHNDFVMREYKRADKAKLWEQFAPDLTRLENSLKDDKWPCNSTPLCGWCPVHTCEYHRERR